MWFLPMIAKAAAAAAKAAAVVAKPIATAAKAVTGIGGASGASSPLATSLAKGVGSAVGGSAPIASSASGMIGNLATGVGNAVGGVQTAAAPTLLQNIGSGAKMLGNLAGKELGLDTLKSDPIGTMKKLGAMNQANAPQGYPNPDTARSSNPMVSASDSSKPLALMGGQDVSGVLTPEEQAIIRQRMMAGRY